MKVRPTQLFKAQRTLKQFISGRRATYGKLLTKWTKVEHQITRELQQKGMKWRDIADAFAMPTEVKRFVLRCRVKATINRHILALEAHRYAVALAVKEFKAKRLAGLKWEDLHLPNEPVLSLDFSRKVVKKLVVKAQTLQPYWGRIVLSLNSYLTESELSRFVNDKLDSATQVKPDSLDLESDIKQTPPASSEPSQANSSQSTSQAYRRHSVMVGHRPNLLGVPQRRGTSAAIQAPLVAVEGNRRKSSIGLAKHSRHKSAGVAVKTVR
jgi:hypothetical protein